MNYLNRLIELIMLMFIVSTMAIAIAGFALGY